MGCAIVIMAFPSRPRPGGLPYQAEDKEGLKSPYTLWANTGTG